MPEILEKTSTVNGAVDIDQLPLKDEKYNLDHCEITIGDLHGNSMQLLSMLVKHSIVQNITEDDYKTLANIYKTPWKLLQKTDIDKFNTILNNLTFNPTTGVRLIGDELASCGQNDYFTLRILQKLRDNCVPVEIMISNHSIEFINACETKGCFEPTNLDQEQASSLCNLQWAITFGMSTREEVLDIYQTAYLPTLKLLSYQLSDDRSEITLFSHAAIDLCTVEVLAEKLGIIYFDASSAAELAQSIDWINARFKQYAAQNQIHTLYDFKKIKGKETSIDFNDNPVEFIMGNRNYATLDRSHTNKDYKVNYVHGHDFDENLNNQQSHIINLASTVDNYKALYAPQRSILFELGSVDSIVNFNAALELIETKKNNFFHLYEDEDDAYDRAFQATSTLVETINIAYRNLTEKIQPTSSDIETFKNTCQKAIDTSRPVLEAHRGWKQVLGHLTLAIAGLGVFYLMGLAAYHLSGSTFTLFKTDSHQKLDNLAQTVDNFAEDACRTLKVQR